MANTSLERGLTILAEVAGGADTTVESVASRLGIPVSSTYRYFKTLKARGFIVEDAGAYRPGRALLALSGQYSVQNHLAEVGTAVLRSIVENVGETAVMIIRVGASAMCLRCAETDKAFKYTFAVNELLPLYAGAGQRLLLAWSPPDVTKQVLDGELIRFTKNTLDADQIRSSLIQIRSAGWAISRGELDPGSVSVAVPVFVSGEVVCSLNVAGPEARCGSKTWVTSALKALNRAAENLSLSLESLSPTINTRKALDAD